MRCGTQFYPSIQSAVFRGKVGRICAIGLIGLAAVTALLAFMISCMEPRHDGEPLSYWLKETGNPDPDRERTARHALQAMRHEAVPFLLRKARGESSLVKEWSRIAWFKLPRAVQQRLPKPRSTDEAVHKISRALRAIGPAAAPMLMLAMEDRNENVRRVAAESFAHGNNPRAQVLWLMKMLGTPDYELKQGAAVMLGMMGSDARLAVPDLVRVMKHDEIDYLRETAARALADLGPHARTGARALKESLNDPAANVRAWSAIALWRINRDPSAVAVLVAELNTVSVDGDGPKYAVLRTLGEIGPLANPAAPDVRRLIGEWDPTRVSFEGVQQAWQLARETLLKIEPQARE